MFDKIGAHNLNLQKWSIDLCGYGPPSYSTFFNGIYAISDDIKSKKQIG